MSSLISPVRARTPRIAAAALERARLTVVPTRTAPAGRAPFAALVILILGAGVVGLLMFNTHMQQASFYATDLQNQADAMTARQQSLQMRIEHLRDPQVLADAGRALGMVAPSVPAFIRLSDGRILGVPTPATAADAVRITPLPPALPAPLVPKPILVTKVVPAKPATTTAAPAKTSAGTGRASTKAGTAKGRNGAAATPQGVRH